MKLLAIITLSCGTSLAKDCPIVVTKSYTTGGSGLFAELTINYKNVSDKEITATAFRVTYYDSLHETHVDKARMTSDLHMGAHGRYKTARWDIPLMGNYTGGGVSVRPVKVTNRTTCACTRLRTGRELMMELP